LSNPADNPKPPAAAPAPRKPSLMEGTAAPRPAGAAEAGENLRMLAELESSARPMERSAARLSTAWIAGLALIVAGAVAWWWGQQSTATAPERPITRTIAAAPATAGATEAATPALPASAASAAAATTARIEAMLEPAPAPQASAAAAAKPSEPAAAPPRVAQASAVAAPAKPRPTRLAAAPPKRAASGAGASARGAAVSTRSAAASTRSATASTRSAVAPAAADRGNNRDADIVLLSALLAHVSREGQAGPLASNDQMTIAQIVQRCEARGGDEARQCRRRICEGYWGKAQACPAYLAPKKG
jgi:ribosomal protein L40E